MDNVTLTAHGQELEVSPTGGGIARYHAQGSRVTVRDAKILAPWPNRVAGAEYDFAGAHHRLPVNEPAHGNAIHGFVRALPWAVDRREADHVTLEMTLAPSTGYPFALSFVATYTLSSEGLAVEVLATNIGTAPCPYGIGMHPYVFFADTSVDDLTLQLSATRWLRNDLRNVPAETLPIADPFDFCEPRRIGTRVLDHALTGLSRDSEGWAHATITAGGARVVLSYACDYVQLYTSDTVPAHRQALAVEPMSCAPNAFNSGEGLLVLAPGGSHALRWKITTLAS